MIGGLPSLWQLGLHMLTVHIQCACANWKVIPVHSLTWKRGKVVVAVTRDTVSLLPACQAQTETWDTNITDDYCIPAISNTPLCTHSMTWAASNLVAFYSKHASHTQARMTDMPYQHLLQHHSQRLLRHMPHWLRTENKAGKHDAWLYFFFQDISALLRHQKERRDAGTMRADLTKCKHINYVPKKHTIL